jgi:integrase/recombinase XerD
VHHGALAYLLGINALRASEAAAVRIEDYQETLRGHRVLHLLGKGNKPATMGCPRRTHFSLVVAIRVARGAQ